MTFFGGIFSSVFNNYEMNVMMFKSLFNFKDTPNHIRILNNKNNTTKMNKKITKLSSSLYNSDSNLDPSNINLNNNFKLKYEKNSEDKKKRNNFVSLNQPIGNITRNFTEVEIKKDINKKIKFYKNTFVKGSTISSYSILEMYLCYVCSRKQKNRMKLYDYALEELNKYLDYLEIIKTLQQFHKIREVIFNKTQEKLFSFYQKPVICLEDVESKSCTKKRRVKFDFEGEDYFPLYEAYIKARRKQDNHKYYKKLIEGVDQDFKKVFDNY